ncbi:MAG: ubiquinone/menaquinone biosynthesis methyltransferase [Planctomycetes bacterium]|nr:ubiquinone/menaquinone biosynthesis methyltransferase [Planctomycetota bacterium]
MASTIVSSDAPLSAGPHSADEVRQMFTAIVPRYDLLNHLLSFGLDRLWRRQLVGQVTQADGHGQPSVALDLGCGTGDMVVALARRLGLSSRVLGLDVCRPMIDHARVKCADLATVSLAVADATSLPAADESCDVATMAFALRNIVDREAALREMVRVVRPGGRIAILEFCRPRGRLWPAIFGFYFRRILPIVGRVVSGHPSAYRYLERSVGVFDDPEHLAARLTALGARVVMQRRLVGGVTAMTVATKVS